MGKPGFYSRREIAGIVQKVRNPNPIFAAGKVFYVDHMLGSNGHDGDDPEKPLATIAHALTLCVTDRDDYIIAMNAPWGVGETTPIVMKRRVHIIGLCRYGVPIVSLFASGDHAIFELYSESADHVEIAGLDLGGGAAHAGIECTGGTVEFAYIHHCNFGSEYCWTNTPKYGVWLPGGVANAKAWKIEDCKFFGSSDASGGKITADGVHIDADFKHEIRNNVFMGLTGIAIYANNVKALVIRGNEIATSTDVAGKGITLDASATRCLVSYNKAAHGTAAGGNNPYVDAAGANANAWTCNYECENLAGPN